MQFKQLFIIVAAVLPISMAASLPERSLPCSAEKHPCKLYGQYEDCSPDYVKYLSQCSSSGCIQWIIDPLAHCDCQSPFHACNNYVNFEKCSPDYIASLKKCVASGCITWIQDPLKECETSTY